MTGKVGSKKLYSLLEITPRATHSCSITWILSLNCKVGSSQNEFPVQGRIYNNYGSSLVRISDH